MPQVRLPGPLVFRPEIPAAPEDLTGGMSLADVIDVVAVIDPAAAVLTAIGGRYITTYATGEADASLWVDDPGVPCCSGTVNLVEHRAHWEHVAWVHVEQMSHAVDRERKRRGQTGDNMAEIDAVTADVMDALQADYVAMETELREARAETDYTDAYYLVPFLALGVPETRFRAYQRAQLPWPVALTFETYGPPRNVRTLAALRMYGTAGIAGLAGPTPVEGPKKKPVRRGHLTLVR